MQVLSGDVPACVIEEMQKEEEEAEQGSGEVLHDDGDQAEALPVTDEMQDKMLDMQKAQQDAGEQSDEQSENEEGEYLLADSDEEVNQFHVVSKVEKVKSFSFREAYQRLDKLGLCSLPRHVQGCSLSYHGKERRWQGLYPTAKVGMSFSWGGITKRNECEALLSAVRAVLTAHCRACPKDKLWASQVDKVKVAEATQKFWSWVCLRFWKCKNCMYVYIYTDIIFIFCFKKRDTLYTEDPGANLGEWPATLTHTRTIARFSIGPHVITGEGQGVLSVGPPL